MNTHANYLHVTNPIIATFIGQNESILLNQILYWISKCGRKIVGQEERWIYNSLAAWHKQFSYWSMYKLRKTIKSLEDLGLVKSVKVNAKRWNHTKWYTVNYNEYNKLLKRLETKKRNNKYPSFNVLNKIILPKKNIVSQGSKFTLEDRLKKSINRFVENQQIIKTKNNYTKDSSICRKLMNQVDQETKNQILCREEVVAKEMKKVWDQVFSYSLRPIKSYLNRKIIKKLEKVKKEKFNNNLEEWEKYVKKINSSQFLVGEKKTRNNFKAVFPWLIKEETIDSIQQGAYGVGDRELDLNNLDKNIKKQEYEIKLKVSEKIFQYLENKINKEKEEQEFKKYLINEEYQEDGDKYKVKKYMEKVSRYRVYGFYITPSHFYYTGNEKLREGIFSSYLMNKYLGIDELLIKEKIREINKKNQSKYIIFIKMKNLANSLKNVSLCQITPSD